MHTPSGLARPSFRSAGRLFNIASARWPSRWAYGCAERPLGEHFPRASRNFSCAVFDGAGELGGQCTTHPPCKSGSMGASVGRPAGGGAPRRPSSAAARRWGIRLHQPAPAVPHLPDLTVITRCSQAGLQWHGNSKRQRASPFHSLIFFWPLAGTHADVAGSPGSDPPLQSQTPSGAGGLLLDTMCRCCARANSLADDWRRRLAAGPGPVRNPEQLLARPAAPGGRQPAWRPVCCKPAEARRGWWCGPYMAHVQDNGAEAYGR